MARAQANTPRNAASRAIAKATSIKIIAAAAMSKNEASFAEAPMFAKNDTQRMPAKITTEIARAMAIPTTNETISHKPSMRRIP